MISLRARLRLFEYVPIGPRISNLISQTLLVLLKWLPPKGKKILVIGTTSELNFLYSVGIRDAFSITYHVPTLNTKDVKKEANIDFKGINLGLEPKDFDLQVHKKLSKNNTNDYFLNTLVGASSIVPQTICNESSVSMHDMSSLLHTELSSDELIGRATGIDHEIDEPQTIASLSSIVRMY